ncbi:hypothetical protein BU251_09150 [Candidatus Velamenicoccus archaeovorus]|jgi:hypothetical protein|uniref:Uncharacterized protein n=1 Tax=Velamenicoccus archaeovorus TaxID=1930593 RepID=A0A410P6Q9_VELA1|nr:hypothetical protein [Candidatus Velamenicoccus archaeovorus]MDD5500534.1 hypothetical protein [Candidatus Omnitrophota bacterium]QAT17877.1 hypothetical protein BU251_09150 [Candidatus Velamenicoccus archaeovorus]
MQNSGNWTKYITPVLVTIAIFMLGTIMAQVSRIDEKLFQHLANDQIHMPRSQFVSKAEFDLHCKFFEKENDRILKAIDDLRNDLKVRSRDGRNQ